MSKALLFEKNYLHLLCDTKQRMLSAQLCQRLGSGFKPTAQGANT